MENPFSKGDKVYICGIATPTKVSFISPQDHKKCTVQVIDVDDGEGYENWMPPSCLSFTPFEPGEMPNHVRPFTPEVGKYYEFSHSQDFSSPFANMLYGITDDGLYKFGESWSAEFCRPIPPSKLGK